MSEQACTERFFLFLYYLRARDLGYEGRDLSVGRNFVTQIHKIRDGLAHVLLSTKLTEWGYRFSGVYLNIPKYIHDHICKEGKLIDKEIPIGEGDLVLHSTRPPLDDWRADANGKEVDYWELPEVPDDKIQIDQVVRRPLDPSYTPIERCILRSLRRVFRNCDRGIITLSDRVQPDIDDNRVQEFRSIQFYEFQGGRVRWLLGKRERKPEEPNLTVGYLISIPKVDGDSFRLLVSFGAGGTETLWFTTLLREVYPDILRQALESKEEKLWILPFLVPDFAPFFFPHDLGSSNNLKPQREYSEFLTWSIR
jgi:hypothetical protein